jgi:hypothetical protein
MTLPSSTLTTLTTFVVVPNLHELRVREVDLLGRSIQPGITWYPGRENSGFTWFYMVLYGFISDVGFEL